MWDWWWAYLALGAFIGFFSGLLGIGGGSAMVPILAFIFAAKGYPTEHALHLALGTGMATVIFTSATSAISHHRHGAVNWPMVRALAPAIIIGSLGGALLTGYLSARMLSVIFTVLIYALATHLLLGGKTEPGGAKPRTLVTWIAGIVIGALSSLAALAGSVMIVPFMVRHGATIHGAIGTAAAVGWPLALAGTVGYFISGLGKTGLPAYSIGYVYLPALVCIVIAGVLMAPLGARIAHRTPGPTLKKVFAVLLYILATKMLVTFF